ncbi:hypothetical protein B0J14DRAFT_264634 [Halenospora varia]|nr:hypothetical protein B0J14DRAFT_264634 [Halenospora varia]
MSYIGFLLLISYISLLPPPQTYMQTCICTVRGDYFINNKRQLFWLLQPIFILSVVNFASAGHYSAFSPNYDSDYYFLVCSGVTHFSVLSSALCYISM